MISPAKCLKANLISWEAIALEKYLEANNLEVTEFMIDLIRKELGIKKDLNLLEKVEALDDRVTNLEARLPK